MNNDKLHYNKSDFLKVMKDSADAVNSLVREYGQLEDYIFRPSWRRIVPIPGIFEKINFGEVSAKIQKMRDELKTYRELHKIAESIGLSDSLCKYINVFLNYTTALDKALQCFEELAFDLYGKGRGFRFKWGEYSLKRKEYANLVKAYDGIADAMYEAYQTAFRN